MLLFAGILSINKNNTPIRHETFITAIKSYTANTPNLTISLFLSHPFPRRNCTPPPHLVRNFCERSVPPRIPPVYLSPSFSRGQPWTRLGGTIITWPFLQPRAGVGSLAKWPALMSRSSNYWGGITSLLVYERAISSYVRRFLFSLRALFAWSCLRSRMSSYCRKTYRCL